MTKIKDVTMRVYSGGTPDTRKSEYWNGSIKWLSSGETRNNFIYDTDKKITDLGVTNSSTKLANKNSIVMACAGQGFTRGQTSYLMDDMYINQSVICIEPDKDKVDELYLYYFFKNSYQLLRKLSDDHSSRGSITTAMIKDLDVEFPNLEIQKKVSAILYSLDNKIELNNEINNNLYELERNIYKEYFKELDDNNNQKLSELCKIKYGKGLPTIKIENEGYPVYGGNGIIGYYHEFMYEDSQILISCRGAASGNVIVSKPQSFVTNNSLILECDRKYHYYLKQYSLDNYYYEYTTGSAQPQITIDNIKDIVLSIPSEESLEEFNKLMEPLENKYFSNLEEINKLEQLRDTLLPKLMNGKIDLDNIEI